VEEEGGEIIVVEEGGVLLEVDALEILQILVEEVKIKIAVSQVIKDSINQISSVITVKSMGIMHMNAERDNIIRKIKVNIIQKTQILPPSLCLWHTLKQFL
jgi:hypothetical protein